MSFRQLIRHRGMVVTATSAVAAMVAGGVIAAVGVGGAHQTLSSAASGQQASSTPTATAKPVPPLQVLSVTPAGGTQDANGASPIKVTFNEALAANTPTPALSPKITGTWTVSGDSMTFQPAVGYKAKTHVTLSIPGGTAGVQAAGLAAGGTTTTAQTGSGLLAKSATVSFTTGAYSTLRLRQLLAQLGYLPLTFTATSSAAPAIAGSDANAQLSAAYDPPAGSFTFQSGYPSALTSQWSDTGSNKILTGAIETFENDHGMTADGVAGPGVWSTLLQAVASNAQNQHGYSYALTNQDSSGGTYVDFYHDGKLTEHTPANTGVPGAATTDGTFNVFEHTYLSLMSGTMPDGSKYKNEPVYWVSYFNGGDALHYYPRASYGSYQSNGCVEMMLSPAKAIWNQSYIGMVVTVEGTES